MVVVVVVLALALAGMVVAFDIAGRRARVNLRRSAARIAATDTARREAEERAEAAEAAAAEAAAGRDRAHAEGEAAVAEAERARRVVQGLWSLELLRQVRLWLLTAGGDDAASVPADTASELAAALGMELDRLREESGLPGGVTVNAEELELPTALSGLRLAQEALAALTRGTDAVEIDVRDGDDGATVEVVIRCEGREAEPDLDVPRQVAEDLGGDLRWDGDALHIRIAV